MYQAYTYWRIWKAFDFYSRIISVNATQYSTSVRINTYELSFQKKSFIWRCVSCLGLNHGTQWFHIRWNILDDSGPLLWLEYGVRASCFFSKPAHYVMHPYHCIFTNKYYIYICRWPQTFQIIESYTLITDIISDMIYMMIAVWISLYNGYVANHIRGGQNIRVFSCWLAIKEKNNLFLAWNITAAIHTMSVCLFSWVSPRQRHIY